MQRILRDCNGLTVYGPSNFTQHVVMIRGGRHPAKGQARREWAPVLREQGEAAGSLGTSGLGSLALTMDKPLPMYLWVTLNCHRLTVPLNPAAAKVEKSNIYIQHS